MSEYYFLASLLPPLEIGRVPTLRFPELKKLLEDNLSQKDRKKMRNFFSIIDFENLRALWAGERLDPRGNYKKEQLEQALLDLTWPTNAPFPGYLVDYLAKYHSNEERLHHFSYLMAQFFIDATENETGFLREYFNFQRELRLVIVGFRAKKYGKDVSLELQFEDPADPIVAQILAQKDAKSYEPPFEYKELKPIFEEFFDAPMELYKMIYEYQFNRIIDLWGTDFFNLDRILNYTARLLLVERWLELDVQKGIQIVDSIEKDIA